MLATLLLLLKEQIHMTGNDVTYINAMIQYYTTLVLNKAKYIGMRNASKLCSFWSRRIVLTKTIKTNKEKQKTMTQKRNQ